MPAIGVAWNVATLGKKTKGRRRQVSRVAR